MEPHDAVFLWMPLLDGTTNSGGIFTQKRETKMEPGIYYDVSWDDYCKIDCMSPSTLKHGVKSMKRLKRAIDGECKPEAKTVAVGNATHCIIAGELERYAVMPNFETDEDNVTATGKPTTSKNSTYYKEQVELWRLDNASKEELTQVQVHTASKVANNVRARCHELIDDSQQEVVLIGEISGVPFKTRLDGLCGSHIWDLKTTAGSIESQAFFRIFDKLGYGFSAAVHVELLRQNGLECKQYSIIAAEVQDDYDVRVFDVPLQLMENAITKVRHVAEQYRIAKKLDHWPGLDDAPLAVSNWAMEQWETEPELEWSL